MGKEKSNKTTNVIVGALGLAVGAVVGFALNEWTNDKEKTKKNESKELVYE